jgi:hypothetical protein
MSDSTAALQPQPKRRNICTECTAKELHLLFEKATVDAAGAIQLLTHPRQFLASNGYDLPPDAKMSIVATEEILARSSSQRGSESVLAAAQMNAISVHISSGMAKCSRVDFE